MKHQYLKAAVPLLWLSVVTSETDEARDRALSYLDDSPGREQHFDHLPAAESGLPSENFAFFESHENVGGGRESFRSGGSMSGGFGGNDFDDFIGADDNFVDDDDFATVGNAGFNDIHHPGGEFRTDPGFHDENPAGPHPQQLGSPGREPFRGETPTNSGLFEGDDFDDFFGDDFVGDAGFASNQGGGQFRSGASRGTPASGPGHHDGNPVVTGSHSNDNLGSFERESFPHSNGNRGSLGRESFRTEGPTGGNFGGRDDFVDDFIGDDFVGDAGFQTHQGGRGQEFRTGGSPGADPGPGFGDGKPTVSGPRSSNDNFGPHHHHSNSFAGAPTIPAHHHHTVAQQPHHHHNTNSQHHHHVAASPLHQHVNANPCGIRGCGNQQRSSDMFVAPPPPLMVVPTGGKGKGKGKRGGFLGGGAAYRGGGSFFSGGGKAKGKGKGRAGFWF